MSITVIPALLLLFFHEVVRGTPRSVEISRLREEIDSIDEGQALAAGA